MAWSSYHPLILDAWTPPLEDLPRWFNATSYPQINEFFIPPSISTYSSSGSLILASSSSVPSGWALSQDPEPTITNNLQSILGVFYQELQYMYVASQAVFGGLIGWRGGDCCWYANTSSSFSALSVSVTDGSSKTIPQADNDFLLFYGAEIGYRSSGSDILISGLAIQEQSTETRDATNWQYISNPHKFETTSLSYWRHPHTSGWIPFSSSQVRDDGLVGFMSSSALKVRTLNKEASKSLDTVNILIDGLPATASRVNIWTPVDTEGLKFGLYRCDGEDTQTFAMRVLAYSWFSKGGNVRGLRNALAASLGQSTLLTLSRTSTGCTLPAYTDFTVQNTKPVQAVVEMGLSINSSGVVLSKYSDVISGTAFINGSAISVTNSGGVLFFENYTPHTSDVINVVWLVRNWSASSGVLSLGSGISKAGDDLTVLGIKNIGVDNNDLDTLLNKFSTWAGLNWGTVTEKEKTLTSISVFD